MTAEPECAHTLGEVHALVRRQGQSYLNCKPYQVDADASFWELMDRLNMAKKVNVRKYGSERGRGTAKHIEPRVRDTPTRLDFGNSKAKGEKKYPNAIPIKGRRRDELDSNDNEGETRTERFKRRGDARTTSSEVLHEDQLLDLCWDLTYRIRCIKQATQYADVLGVTIQGCNEIDLNQWLTEELYRTGPEFAMRHAAFDLVENLVEQAELFEMPTRRRNEEKAIKYVTIAVIVKEGWSEAYSGTSLGIANDIKMLAAGRHMILRSDVYESGYIRDCIRPRKEDEVHGASFSQSTAGNRNSTRAVTPPVVVRGGFEY